MRRFAPYEWNDELRKQFDNVLQGPGVTWDKKGILAAFDRAVAKTCLELLAPLDNL